MGADCSKSENIRCELSSIHAPVSSLEKASDATKSAQRESLSPGVVESTGSNVCEPKCDAYRSQGVLMPEPLLLRSLQKLKSLVSTFNFIGPSQALTLTKKPRGSNTQATMDALNGHGTTLIVGFDGPSSRGHFYNVWLRRSHDQVTLDVRDSNLPSRGERPLVARLRKILGIPSAGVTTTVHYRESSAVDVGACGLACLHDAATMLEVDSSPFNSRDSFVDWYKGDLGLRSRRQRTETDMRNTAAATAQTATPKNASTPRLTQPVTGRCAGAAKCLLCKKSPCECDDILRRSANDSGSQRNARALSNAEIRAAMAKIPIGANIRCIWDWIGSSQPKDTRLREWYGQVLQLEGTSRSPVWKVRFWGSPFGPLIADDGTTIEDEFASLPPLPATRVANRSAHVSNPNFRILLLSKLDAVPDPVAFQREATSSDDDKSSDAESNDSDDESHDVQVAPYTYLDESSTTLDEALFGDPAPTLLAPTSIFTGGDFLKLRLLTADEARTRCPDLVWCAVTKAVRVRHISALHAFATYVTDHPSTRSITIDVLLAHFVQEERKVRDWRWTTVARTAANLIGAFANLPLYTKGGSALNLTAFAFFKALLQAAQRLSSEQGIREPPAVTTPEMDTVIANVGSPRTRAALILAWTTAQRPGDIVQLRHDDVTLDNNNGELKVRFRRGKTVGTKGEFHIISKISNQQWRNFLRDYMQTCDTEYLFPLRNAYQRTILLSGMKTALRGVNPQLELRSLRRGTLQALAAAGATEEELLQFSRHSDVATLRRYLSFGAQPHAAQRSAQSRAAIALSTAVPLLAGGAARTIAADGDPKLVFEDWFAIGADGEPIISLDRAPKLPLSVLRQDTKKWPVHGKEPVKEPLDIRVLDDMAASCPEDVRRAWVEDRPWVTNEDSRYDQVPWDGRLLKASIVKEQLSRLVELGIVQIVPDNEKHKIKGTIKVFLRPEPDKVPPRNRVIKHTIDINNTFGRDTVRDRRNATRRSARGAILNASGCIVLDVAAQFDHFQLADAISWRQCFTVDDGTGHLITARNLRMCMGQRQSTQVGSSSTDILLDFPSPTVCKQKATDNVRFTGDREDTIDAAWTFVQRCKKARVKLNEVNIDTATRDDVAALWCTEADFIGEIANYANKTVRCRQRHVDRLSRLLSANTGRDATYATLFAWYAMLLYMSETLGLRVDRFYATRQFFCNLARQLSPQPDAWDTRCVNRPPKEIFQWTALALENKPATLVPRPPVNALVQVDSSALGFAAIITTLSPAGPTTQLFQRRWEGHVPFDTRFSTNTEPEGIARSLDFLKKQFSDRPALVLTDHQSFVDALRKGVSSSPFYNSRISRIKDRFNYVELLHHPGVKMLADKYSRFVATELLPEDKAESERLAAELVPVRNVGRDVGRGRGSVLHGVATVTVDP